MQRFTPICGKLHICGKLWGRQVQLRCMCERICVHHVRKPLVLQASEVSTVWKRVSTCC